MSKIFVVFFLFFVLFSHSIFWESDEIELISRAEWWANEEYRYIDSTEWKDIIKQRILNRKAAEEALQELSTEERIEKWKKSAIAYDLSELRNSYLLENFSDDIILAKTNREENGRKLAWPQKYTHYVNSIVVHHTTWDYEDSYDAMRKIYKFHALSRQWWDIGYNYLIWLDGEIFEWRSGGDYVVWAHNKWNNRSTVWVALIGNYDTHQPSETQLESLEKIILYLSKKYGIDMQNKVPIHNTCLAESCTTKWALYTQYHTPITGHRDGGHTSCPWINVYEKLDSITQRVAEKTFWLQRVKNPILENAKVDIQAKIKKLNTQNSIKKKIQQTNEYNAAMKRFNKLPWERVRKTIAKIWEQKLLNIYIKIQVLNQGDSEVYKTLVLTEIENIISDRLDVLNTAHETDILWTDDTIALAFDDINTIKIKLSYPLSDTISIRSSTGYKWDISKLSSKFEIPFLKDLEHSRSFEQLDFSYANSRVNISDTMKLRLRSGKKIRIQSPQDGYLEISSWERKPSWDTTWKLNNNTFRWDILLSIEDEKFVVVNELTISDYLKWLGEVSNDESPEKIKTIIVAARTYARWYTTQARKFEGAWYDGSDNPDEFQQYLWYGLEQRSPNINTLVDQTSDEVITYEDELIKPWYHSSSNGKTISFMQYCPDCEDKHNYPYLASVKDYSQDATQTLWHGVWIPWTWVSDLASRAWKYPMIIKYFLPGTKVEKISNPQ